MVTMAKKHFAPEFHVTQGNDAGRFKEVVKAGAWMKKYQSLNFDSTESFFQALGDVLTNYVKDLGYGGFEIEIIGHSKNFVNARIGMTYTSEPELGGKRWLYVEDWRMTTNEEQKFTNLHITHTTFKEFTGTVFPSLPTYRGDSSGTVWRSMT